MATVDVLLPVRNGLPFLGEAIESIRTQTFTDWRLLILDHGSSTVRWSSLKSMRKRMPELKCSRFQMPTA